jgi:hypothetical protein
MTLTTDPEEARNSGVRADGQQNKYAVLSDEERAKGFVRPVRRSYKHVGARPTHPVRDLSPEETARYQQFGYVQFEAYPCAAIVDPDGPTPACGYPSDNERHVEGADFLHHFLNANGSSVTGRFWTAAQLASGCGAVTTMAEAIAETYARDPGFYSGTFCVSCRTHLPVGEAGEFVWTDDGTRVGT